MGDRNYTNYRVVQGLCWGYIAIMENKMETTIMGMRASNGFRVQGLGVDFRVESLGVCRVGQGLRNSIASGFRS